MPVTSRHHTARYVHFLALFSLVCGVLLTATTPAITASQTPDNSPTHLGTPLPTTDPDTPVADGIIVKLRDGAQLAQAERMTLAQQPWVVREQQAEYMVLDVPPGEEMTQAKHLMTDDRVLYAEPNWIRQAHDTFSEQWYVAKVGAIAAHQTVGTGAASTILAIVDTGIDYGHPRLRSQIIAGYDFVDNDASAADDHGHGTLVAGVASAMCPACSLLPVRVLSNGYGSDYAVSNGIKYAADRGAHVINLSLGGEQPSQTLCDMVAYAQSKGALVVAAAGNDGRAKWSYPANCNAEVLRVGATGPDDALASYSNTGFDLDLVAPGGDLPSYTHPADDRLMVSTCRGGGYCGAVGTSMASPAVTGAAGLLRSAKPALSAQQIGTVLVQTADDLGAKGYDETYGWGRMNLARAVGRDVAPWILEPAADPAWVTAQGGTVQVSAYVRDDRRIVRATLRIPALKATVQMAGSDRYVGTANIPATAQNTVNIYPTTLEAEDSAGQRITVNGPTLYQSVSIWETSAWPMVRRDPQHTGRSFERIAVPPRQVSRIPAPQAITQEQCSQGGAFVFCGIRGLGGPPPPHCTADVYRGGGIFRAIDPAAGEVAWELSCVKGNNIGPDTGWTPPVFHQGKVVFIDGRGVVTAATADRGAIIWQTQVDPENWSAGMVVEDDLLYVPSAETMMTALDINTGEQVWYQPWSYSWGDITASPTVAVGLVVVPIYHSIQGTSYLLALDARTGAAIWQSPTVEGRIAEGILYWQGSFYFATYYGYFYRADATTGKVIWNKQMESGPSYGIPKLAVSYDGLIILSVNGDEPQIVAFDTTGTVRWQTSWKTQNLQPSWPIVLGNSIVVGTSAARLRVLYADTGKIAWESGPLSAATTWSAPFWDGERLVWSTADGKETWVFDMLALAPSTFAYVHLPLVQR